MDALAASAAKASWAQLQLHPLSINVSFHLAPVQDDDMDDAGIVRDLLRSVSVAVSNIDNVPIRLNALLLNVCQQRRGLCNFF